MTEYGWDASDYDWTRGPCDVALAHSQGINLLTHKISEGTSYRAQHAGTVLRRGLAAGVPVLGGYHVLYPASMAPLEAQADWFLAGLDAVFPAWRTHPCFILQIDAEKFKYMDRAPSLHEINAFAKLLMQKAGLLATQVVVYGPHWLYGDQLHDLHHHPLWASSYVQGAGQFKDLYPGDNAGQWGAYGGIVPTVLQYASTATIAGQHPSDANAIRVDGAAALQALFVPTATGPKEDPMTPAQIDQLADKIASRVVHHELTLGGAKQQLGRAVMLAAKHAQQADHAINAANGVLARVAAVQATLTTIGAGGVDAAKVARLVVRRMAAALAGTTTGSGS